MKYLPAFLILATAAHAQETKLDWTEDLTRACEIASAENKLVFCRQILCDFKEKVCAYAEIARRPWFLESDAVRRLVAKRCIPVVLHVAPGDYRKGMHDPQDLAG